MAKATLTLPNGTRVVIEGEPEEVRRLLNLAGGTAAEPTSSTSRRSKPPRPTKAHRPAHSADEVGADLSQIANLVKDCEEAEAIEKNILDRTSTVNRVLLPLYVSKKYARSDSGLTSGEVSTVTTELGVPVSQPNASTALSGAASKYVMGDKVRRRGHTVRYRLSRRGEKYLGAVINGEAGED